MEKRYVYIFVKKFGLNGKQKLEKFILDTRVLFQEIAKNKNRYALSSEQLIKAIKKNWINDFDVLNKKEYIGEFVESGESVINSRMTLEERKEIIKEEFEKMDKNAELYISDPFIFGNYSAMEESLEYLKVIFETLKPSKINIYYKTGIEINKEFILNKIKEFCGYEAYTNNVICKNNNEIHDRFYITNNTGKCLGTSISGIHNKLFLISNINRQDIQDIKEFLGTIE